MEKDNTNNKQDTLEKPPIYSIIDRIFDKSIWLKGLNLTKEYIPLILILISGLGAAIQIIEISKIDMAYIRFFSVTQLTADGTLVAITLLASYIIYKFYLTTLVVMTPITNLEKALKTEDKTYKTSKDIPSVIAFLQGVSAAAIFMHVGPFKDNLLIMIALSSMIIAGLTFVLKYFLLYRRYTKMREPTTKQSWADIVLTIGPAALIAYTLINLGNIYLDLYNIPTPERLTNYSYIDSRIAQDYGSSAKYDIRYFNDKYVFIGIVQDKKIAIYKTDDILFNAQHIIIE